LAQGSRFSPDHRRWWRQLRGLLQAAAMGPANCKVHNDTRYTVTVKVFNYADSIRTIPKEEHTLSPNETAQCYALAHGSGLILGIGKTYLGCKNGGIASVSAIAWNGDGGFWHPQVRGELTMVRRALGQCIDEETRCRGKISPADRKVTCAKEAVSVAQERVKALQEERDNLAREKTSLEVAKNDHEKKQRVGSRLLQMLQSDRDSDSDGDDLPVAKRAKIECLGADIDSINSRIAEIDARLEDLPDLIAKAQQQMNQQENEVLECEKAFGRGGAPLETNVGRCINEVHGPDDSLAR